MLSQESRSDGKGKKDKTEETTKMWWGIAKLTTASEENTIDSWVTHNLSGEKVKFTC